MPLRYVNYKCITTPLALTSLGTPKLTLAVAVDDVVMFVTHSLS